MQCAELQKCNLDLTHPLQQKTCKEWALSLGAAAFEALPRRALFQELDQVSALILFCNVEPHVVARNHRVGVG
jgi:hypothetical protein